MSSGRRFAVVTPKVVPGEGVESSPTARTRTFAKVAPAGENPRHDIIREFYSGDNGNTPWDFYCDDARCIPIEIDGCWHHAWFCQWWNKAENKTKTPF
jgi:hypothetical protein